MKKIILIFAAVMLALIFCFGAGAASSQMAMVPFDATWVLHADVQRYVSSVMYKQLSDDADVAKMREKAGKFFEKFRIDPARDLTSVTVFGRGESEEEPVVAISGNLDKTYLLGLLKTASSQKEIPYGKYTIYCWDNDHCGVFATERLVLISEKEENIRWALDALDGKIKNISVSPLVSRLEKESPNAIVLAAATNISGMVGKRENPVMLSKMRTAALSLMEVGSVVDLKIDIGTESAQVAKEIEQAIRGIIAIVNLQLTNADVQTLTQSINIVLEGEKVKINASYPISKLVELLKKRHFSIEEFGPFDNF
jgi:hypothetical protein